MADGAENGETTPDKGSKLVTVAAAVATAIGTLGWVAFIGGAILWISFSRAHLPPAESVAKVPTGVLVATGAEFVVWAALAALITVAALYMFDDRVQRRQTQRRLDDKLRLTRELRARETRAEELAAIAQRAGASQEGEEARRQLIAAEIDVEATNEALVEVSSSDWKRAFRRGLLPGGLVAGTAILAAIFIRLGYGNLPVPVGAAVVLGAAVFIGVIGAMLYSTTARFSVIGVFALFAIPLVMAIATYFRADAAPRVEPVAFLKADGTPFVGFFVAQTSDRVYVGTFDVTTNPCNLLHRTSCHDQLPKITVPARLLSLPIDDVRNLTIGPREPLDAQDAEFDSGGPRSAREWAGTAALHLCDDARAARNKAIAAARRTGGGGTDQTLPPICSKDDEQYLRDFYETEQQNVDDQDRMRG